MQIHIYYIGVECAQRPKKNELHLSVIHDSHSALRRERGPEADPHWSAGISTHLHHVTQKAFEKGPAVMHWQGEPG